VPEPVPQPRCGESLECLGISAQCYNGFEKFSHKQPGQPAGEDCVRCFQQRVRLWADTHPEAEQILERYCNFPATDDQTKLRQFNDFVKCYCFTPDDPFVWPATTTTTPAPSADPLPPHIYTTTTGPSPSNTCNIRTGCEIALYSTCKRSSLAAGCARAALGAVAPSAGTFSSDDGTFDDVSVVAGQVANTTGMFCPANASLAASHEAGHKVSSSRLLRGQVLPTSSRVHSLTDDGGVAASLVERASRLHAASSATSLDGTTGGKCYKCLVDAQVQLQTYGCPGSDFGYRSMMFCYCGIDY